MPTRASDAWWRCRNTVLARQPEAALTGAYAESAASGRTERTYGETQYAATPGCGPGVARTES